MRRGTDGHEHPPERTSPAPSVLATPAVGLLLAALLSLLVPPAKRLLGEGRPTPAPVIYAVGAGASDRLLWSPASPTGPADGTVLLGGGGPGPPVGGWRGLLLGQPLDLNAATTQDLEALPRVGPRTAEAILAERERSGGFDGIEDLLRVRGIGPKTLRELRPLVRVGAAGRPNP